MEKLTIQEEEAMIYIWELGSCFVKDIVAKYPQPAPPYTTVASIIKKPGTQTVCYSRSRREYISIHTLPFVKANTSVPS